MSDLVDRLRALPWHEPAIAEAADEIERLRGDLEVMRLQRDATQASRCPNCERLRAAVAQQAEDDGLWFIAETAPEAYLQNALRYLHALIEQDTQALQALKGADDG